MNNVVDIGISNTYGSVTAYEEGGKYFLALDDYSGTDEKEISKELYIMLDIEFNG